MVTCLKSLIGSLNMQMLLYLPYKYVTCNMADVVLTSLDFYTIDNSLSMHVGNRKYVVL